jgi:hypothetical protein
MRKKIFIILPLLIFLFLGCRDNSTSYSGTIDAARFRNPFKEDRATLFYSLNDSLEPNVLQKQIAEFANAGIGGVFFHAREGLMTQYFSEDWWNIIDAGVKQCVASGIDPWFYDEYKWPSGYAAGYVPTKSKDYRARYLARIAKGKEIPQEGIIVSEDADYTYVCMTTAFGNPWLNGTCKIDYLNPEAVKAFIEHTYLTYSDRNKQKYNFAGKGIFFDEPDIRPASDGRNFDGVISYSPSFREAFLKEKGYDIADKFACLFEEKQGYRKVRLDYWQMLGAQYEKAFVGQLGDFCAANNLTLTGHFFPEENLAGNKGGIGNLMRQLRREDMPGMDHLELRIEGGLNVAKSVSSVANQYGKKRRMSELFGVSGQNMSFEDRQWIANWHAVLGINFFVEHLALYSMKGERKRDFPPVISNQQPWWPDNKLVEDYMGRLCYLSTLGKYAASTLLLVPIESEYIADRRESNKLFDDYYSAMENLMDIHCDFDLGDEQIMEEIGAVNGNLFKVGEMEYEYIIVPELLTLRETTVSKLIEFTQKGGKLFILGNYPRYIDAESFHLLEQLKRSSILLPNTKEELQKKLPLGLSIQHRPEAKIYTQKRILKDGEMFFITNLSRINTEDVTISFDIPPKDLMLWNLSDGESYAVAVNKDNRVELELEVAGFYVLTTGKATAENMKPKPYQGSSTLEVVKTITMPWNGKKINPNAITLDYACYSIHDGLNYSESEPIIGITSRLNAQQYNGPLQLKYEVELSETLSNVELAVESPAMYQSIAINGIALPPFSDTNYYWDYSFKKTNNIASYLHPGKNTIVFKLNYKCPINSDPTFANRYGTEVESIYLIGDFAVKSKRATWNVRDTEKNNSSVFVQKPVHHLNNFSLETEPTSFTDDLTRCGYPFYAGKFEMNNQFIIDKINPEREYYVTLPLSEAIVYELNINGHYVDKLTSSPFRRDITSYIKEGENDIRFVLCNSLRNLLGPHHHNGGELKGTSPLSFTGAGGWPHGQGDRNWYDLRLDNRSDLKIWTDHYNIIPFGFIKPVEICKSVQ